VSHQRKNDKRVLVLGGFERLMHGLADHRGQGYVTKRINEHDYWYKWRYNRVTQKHDWSYVGPVDKVNPRAQHDLDPLAMLDYKVVGENLLLRFGDWKRVRQHFAGCVALEWRPV